MSTKINWTEAEIEFIKKNRINMTFKMLSTKIDKSISQIKEKCLELKILRYKVKNWTKEEEQYLLSNFKNKKIDILCNDLNRTRGSIYKKLSTLESYIFHIKKRTELSKDRHNLLYQNSDDSKIENDILDRKQLESSKIKNRNDILIWDYVQDFKNMTPETAYVLGFITGDGWISRPDAKYYQVMVTNKVDDAIPYMEPIFTKMAKWQVSYKTDRTGTRKDQLRFTISNKTLVNFLNEDLDLKNKNNYFSQTLIDFIPEYLHQYLLRGLFDADGGVYITHSLLSCDIASNYHFDWTNLVNLIKNHINVDVNVKQFEMKKSQSLGSRMLITKLESCCNFLNFIYKDYPSDGMGFKRKYNKFINYLEYREHSPYYSKMIPTSELLKGV